MISEKNYQTVKGGIFFCVSPDSVGNLRDLTKRLVCLPASVNKNVGGKNEQGSKHAF